MGGGKGEISNKTFSNRTESFIIGNQIGRVGKTVVFFEIEVR